MGIPLGSDYSTINYTQLRYDINCQANDILSGGYIMKDLERERETECWVDIFEGDTFDGTLLRLPEGRHECCCRQLNASPA